MLVIDTDTIPRRDRLAMVVDSVTGPTAATSFTAESGKGAVRMRMSSWDLGGLELFDATCSAHTLRRTTSSKVDDDDDPALLLTLGLSGTGVHRNLDREVSVRPSVLWATDLSAPYLHHIDDTHTLTAKLPFDALGMPSDVVRPALVHLDKSPLARLFSTHLLEVRRVADQVDREAALSVGTATLSLARALVASVAKGTGADRVFLDDVLLQRVRSFVLEHLGDPDLDAETIAAAHFVSVRQLYKLCARSDLRLQQWIIHERLARAAEQLARSPASSGTISAVAFTCGFTSASHFTTRFRRAYGVSPRDWQALNQEK